MFFRLGSDVVVRPIKKSDSAWIHKELQDYEIAHWLLGVPYPFTEYDAEEFVDEWLDKKDDIACCAAIVRYSGAAKQGEVIEEGLGFITLKESEAEIGKHILGYWLVRREWGSGLAFKAVREFMNETRRRQSKLWVLLIVEQGNYRSMGLARKLGWEQTQTARYQCTTRGKRNNEILKLVRFEKKWSPHHKAT